MPYRSDRKFTDKVHEKAALKYIYKRLGWKIKNIDPEKLEKMDMKKGIDYVFTDSFGKTVTVQERFREKSYKTYNDFTLRYRRDANNNADRKKSEFYKIEADYIVYGIIDKSKEYVMNNGNDIGFEKFAVINSKVLFELISQGYIAVDINAGENYFENGKMHISIKQNSDGSSSFAVFDLKMLNDMFSRQELIILQEGFI